jgi:phytol kinase
MSEELLHVVLLALGFGLLFASAEWLYHKRRVPAEYTRKYVHLSTGVLAMAFPFLFNDHWPVLFLCGGFLLILLLSLKLGLLPSINAVDRKTRGSVLFPIVVYCCFLTYRHYGLYIFYYLPILVLAFCDPAAAFVGKRWPWGRFTLLGHTKTLSGSLAFFAVASLLGVFLFRSAEEAPMGEAIVLALLVAASTTVAEAVTHWGYDNLTIPTVATAILAFAKSCFSFF